MGSTNRHEHSHSNGYTSSTRGDIGNHGAENRKFAGSEQGLTFDEHGTILQQGTGLVMSLLKLGIRSLTFRNVSATIAVPQDGYL